MTLSIQPRAAERYAVLLDLARTLASTLNPSTLYASIHAQVTRVIPVSSFGIGLTQSGGRLEMVFSAGKPSGCVRLTATEIERLRAGDYVFQPATAHRGPTLASPLLREHRLLGCMVTERTDVEAFPKADVYFLVAVGRLAGVALDNSRLFEEAKRRQAEAEFLQATSRDLSATLELGDTAGRLARRVARLIAQPVVVWSVDGLRADAVGRAGGGTVPPGERRSLSSGAATRLLRIGREPQRIVDPARDRPDRLLVPLTLARRLVGLISVGPWPPGKEPPPDRVRLLIRMIPHAAPALENARLHAQVRKMSLTDPLVGLPNRRALELTLAREFAAAIRGRALSFTLFDLDWFKQYNDRHGHPAGDAALIRVANVLRQETRAMNMAARYGGEEFATIFAGAEVGEGTIHAERVRQRIETEFEGELTVSAGIADFAPDMETAADLIEAADRALYRAKLEGRNRIHVSRD